MTLLDRPPRAAPAEAPPRRRLPLDPGTAVLVVAVGIHLWLCWELRTFVTDDSWISVRYAENLAAGHGFVFNPGGPRVEGYSNPLLVGVEALADVVGIPAIGAARALGVLSGVACLVVVSLRGRHVVGPAGAAAATVLLACSVPIAVWAVGGLETLPVALLVTVAAVELARPDGGRVWPAALAMALLPWLRPEGLAAVAVLVALSEGPGLLRRATRAAALRRLLVLGGVPVASQVLVEAFRLGVYGHLLPNSVIYKAGHGEPFEVAEKFLAQGIVVLLPAVVGLALATGRRRLLAVPPVVYLLGSIGMADSVNGFSRFFMPVWPLVTLLAGLGVAGLLGRAGGRRRAIAVGAVVAAAGAALLTLPPGDLRSAKAFAQDYQDCRTNPREELAAWLRATPEGTRYAISDAGLVPARGKRTAYDSFTLNEALIQERGRLTAQEQAEEVFRRSPDVVVVASSSPDPDVFAGSYPNDQLVHDRVESEGYRLAFVASGPVPGCRYSLWAYRR
jgi:arabinofuranosyltransferase